MNKKKPGINKSPRAGGKKGNTKKSGENKSSESKEKY